MKKVTAIILTYNEEKNISDALDSVEWADEILVVDSYSTDRTEAIVRQYPEVKWLQNTFTSHSDQRNWAMDKSDSSWVFMLDADERVTNKLKNSILRWKSESQNEGITAYEMKRQNYFFGQKLRFLWSGDSVVRLFLKSKSSYAPVAVHEEVTTEGSIRLIEGSIDHHTFSSMKEYRDKLETYAQWSASDHEKKVNQIGIYHLWIKPSFRFFKHYILQLGILDGKAGFVISQLMAWGVKRRYEIIQERRKKNED